LPDYLPDRFPTGLDMTVLSESEWEQLAERSPAWHAAISRGIAL
jgi:hypothetical protein